LLAVRPGREGEVLDANSSARPQGENRLQIVWKTKRSVAKKPSLILANDLIISIDDSGIASCLDARTGTEVWRERVGGNYSASPIASDGRVYFLSEEGKTTVIEAGRQFRVLAENTLDDGFMASPAVAGNALYLRTKTAVYRVEE
jgi:outer membrane protein assembly factor BamB